METQDIVIVEGEKMHLKIPYRAIPKPSMTWKKDDTELKTGDRLTLACELNNIQIELLKCKHEDAGVYTVTLENSLGSVTGTVNVKVIGKATSLPPKVLFYIFVKRNLVQQNAFHQ